MTTSTSEFYDTYELEPDHGLVNALYKIEKSLGGQDFSGIQRNFVLPIAWGFYGVRHKNF